MTQLDYDQLLELLAAETVSPRGAALARALRPASEYTRVRSLLIETEEARQLIDSGASVPLSAMSGVDPLLELLGKGAIYGRQELEQLAAWLQAVRQMQRYMADKAERALYLGGYAERMESCPQLRETLETSIRYGEITDEASPELGRIRRHLRTAEEQVRRRIDQALMKHRDSLQELVVSQRGGHYVLAVKRSARKQVKGAVLDESASGQTLFIEPQEVVAAHGEWSSWQSEEAQEESRILAQLSSLVDAHHRELTANAETMAQYDFIFARAKLAVRQQGCLPRLMDAPILRLRGARHPLLGEGTVPLSLRLDDTVRQLIITGPNTGGKTIALKTVGLLAMMMQSGLLVPVDPQSELGVFDLVFADVGDGQSMSQSLSTFSAHISAVAAMLARASGRTLVLLDELAAGTDPAEGIALSIVILEELAERGTRVVATTHFNEIKTYAANTPGCRNARMAFDPESLRPLYRLEMGAAGESHALAIAARYGLPARVLRRAEARLQTARSGAWPDTAQMSAAKPTEDEWPDDEQDAVKAATRSGGRPTAQPTLRQGDSVWVHPLGCIGIVYKGPDPRGEVIVQVQGRKLAYNQKRLTLQISAAELYPEDYDLSIVFDAKETRKLRKQMSRKYIEGASIESGEEPGKRS
ncbi:hypothetical protein PA598K_04298 [Paenibacillus sp. 598K]|nr:hypothetical protein PA598K_04298 [Paenibacillus sp. 598K]